MPGKPGFLGELKRRHIWRVAIAYAVAGWLLVQIATQVLPVFHMPDWSPQLVVILVVIGFPFALVLAWAFEFTPDGIRRTEPADSPDARPGQGASGPKFNTLVISVLIIAVALLGWRLLAVRHDGNASRRSPDVAQRSAGPAVPGSTVGAAVHAAPIPSDSAAAGTTGAVSPAAFQPPAASIVVLPFVNMSDDPKQQYFSDGITQELTGALGQNRGLSVIAWNTASKFAGSTQSPSEVGRALNVAHVLAGSIQRVGQRVRVSAELIDTVNGRQLWSAHYDDTLTNLFAVQDKISAAIAGALNVKFAGMRSSPTLDPRAHELYLKGLVALDRATAVDAQAAQDYFQQALALDPGYADAWAGLAQSYTWLELFSTLPPEEGKVKLRVAANKALALDPDNVNALVALGGADLVDGKFADATAKFVRAIELDPSSSAARQGYGLVLPTKQALVQFREAVRLDPQYAMSLSSLSVAYLNLGDWSGAVAAAKTLKEVAPKNIDAAFLLAFGYTQLRRGEDAVQAFDQVQPTTKVDVHLLEAGRLTYRALREPGLRVQALASLDALRRTDLSPIGRIDLAQLYLALGEKQPAMDMLDVFCAAAPVGCRDLAISPIYASIRGEPRFGKLARRYGTETLDGAPASATSR